MRMVDAVVDEPVTAPEPEDVDVDTPAVEARQWNKHDVKKLEAECNQLMAAMNQAGRTVNVAALMDGGHAYAACRLLVLKGLATEEEVNGEAFTWIRRKLMGGLQLAENNRLTVARKPGLMVATH